jgi:hypothetical protein
MEYFAKRFVHLARSANPKRDSCRFELVNHDGRLSKSLDHRGLAAFLPRNLRSGVKD